MMVRKEILGIGILILVLVGIYLALPILFGEPTNSAEPNESLELNKSTEITEPEYSIIPLEFFLYNEGKDVHKVAVKIFDSNNVSIFNETYEMNPDDSIYVSEITTKKGSYRYELTLDDKYNKTYYASVRESTGLDSSETLTILAYDDPNEPFRVIYMIA